MAFKSGRTKKGPSKSQKTGRREGRHSNTKRRRGFKVKQTKYGNFLMKDRKKGEKRSEEDDVKQKLEKSKLKAQRSNKSVQKKNGKKVNDRQAASQDKKLQFSGKSRFNPKEGLNKRKKKKNLNEQGGMMINTLLEIDERQYEPKKKKQKLIDGIEWLVDKENNMKVLPIDEELVKQKKGESNETFYKRMCKYTQMVIDEVVYQEKLQISFKKDEKGQIIKVEKDEDVERKLLQPKKHKKISEERKNKKWKLKAKEKKLRKKEKKTEPDSQPEDIFLPEYIEYGDIVHAPPHIDTTKLTRKLPEDQKNSTPGFLFMEDYDKKKKETFKLTSALPTAQEWLLEEKKRKAKDTNELVKIKRRKGNNQNKNE